MKAMQTNDLPKGDCVFECIANVTKIYRGNGLIDQVTLTRLYLNAVSGDKLFGDIVTSAIAVCMNESNSETPQWSLTFIISFQRASRLTSCDKAQA